MLRGMVRENQPTIRAAALKLTLATITRHPERERIEAAIPSELREAIEEARPTDWVPATLMLELLERLWRVLERDAFIALYAEQVALAQSSSSFGRFMNQITKLLAPTPQARLRHLPRGLELAQRDAGRMEVELAGSAMAHVVVRDLPSLLRNICYATSLIGSLESCARMVGWVPSVEMDARELSIGVVRYLMRWERAAT